MLEPLKKKGLLLAICLAFIGIDQIVKQWTFFSIPLMSYFGGYPYGGIGVFKYFLGVEFSIVHATNVGAAWSLFSDYSIGLLWIRIVLILVLAYFLFREDKTSSRFPWMLIFSGAVSNVIDHFVHGHVIDMFHFILWGYDYPVFNLADAFIFSGALMLVFKQGDCRVATSKS